MLLYIRAVHFNGEFNISQRFNNRVDIRYIRAVNFNGEFNNSYLRAFYRYFNNELIISHHQ